MKTVTSGLTRLATVTVLTLLLLPVLAESGGVGGGNLPPPPIKGVVVRPHGTMTKPMIRCM